MKQWLTIAVFIYCCSCGRGKYYVSDKFRTSDISVLKRLHIDSSYDLYLRKVYKDKNDKNENILKTTLAKGDTVNKTLIEIEYLLVSCRHKMAIYISTVPDKYQRYYSSNHMADSLVNAYDFSTFYFGRIADDGEDILFVSDPRAKKISWDIRPFLKNTNPDQISIRELSVQRNDNIENVILVNKALEEPLRFVRQKKFAIVFQYPPVKQLPQSELPGLLDQTFYFDFSVKGAGIYFRFDKNIGDSKDSAIHYDYRRMRYPPVWLP